MRVTYLIARSIEGTLGELLADLPIPPGADIPPPTLEEVLAKMKELCFIVETVAHLQGREGTLLPTVDQARKLIERLQPSQ